MDEATREAIYEAMQKQFEDVDHLATRIKRFEADARFALDHQDEWRTAYPDHWVAVFHCDLVAVDRDKSSLLETVKNSQIPLDDTYVDFLPREKPILMLG